MLIQPAVIQVANAFRLNACLPFALGIAIFLGVGNSRKCLSAECVFTIKSMSPEQAALIRKVANAFRLNACLRLGCLYESTADRPAVANAFRLNACLRL